MNLRGIEIKAAMVGAIATASFFCALTFAQEDQAAHARQAQQDLQNKRPDLAIAEFQAILAMNPGNLDARANLGVLEYFQNQYAKAAPDLRLALEANPSLWKLRALLGMSEKRTGQNAQAQGDLAAAFPHIEEQKLRHEAGLELIEIDYALGDLGKAAEVVNVLRQAEPADVDVLYAAHRIYSELSDETTLALALTAPDSARMHQLMAHELARQAKDEAAIANYRAALKIDPHRADIHYELAEMLFTQSSSAAQAEAETEYKSALAGNPFDEKSECRLGDIALRRSDPKAAQAYYARALEMQPSDPSANLGMAKVLMALHEPAKAEPPLERAAQLEPFDAATHYRLGVLYRELGRAEDSRRELAEFEKLKKMKSRLSEIYQQMRLAPAKPEQPDADLP
ncbi:MAG: tetratricopeptide repeat protein [Acidobacteriaceae bacterium]|nr:tetratricopeptide repeat protein [Acidobacteriaceae bacterium]